MGDKIGKVTEAVGRVTGDREVEAKGRVEQDALDPDESVEEVTERRSRRRSRSCEASTVTSTRKPDRC